MSKRLNEPLARLWRRVVDQRWAYFFVLPAYVLFILFTLKPFVEGLTLSLFKTTLSGKTWAGLANFIGLFRDESFLKALQNTFIFVLGVVPITLGLSLLISVLVFPLNKWFQSFFRMAFYMPTVAAGVVLSMVWLWIFNPAYGLLNYLLNLVGMKPVQWLGSMEWALPSLALVVITWVIGQPIILFLAALGGIPHEFHEAAAIDGATGWKTFWHVTLPLLRPTLLFVLLTQTIATFQVYIVVMLLTRGGPAFATQTIVYRMYESAFEFYDFGYAAAMGVILLLIVSAVAVIQYRYFGQQVEY